VARFSTLLAINHILVLIIVVVTIFNLLHVRIHSEISKLIVAWGVGSKTYHKCFILG
jgi:hypothetical protein